MEDTTPVRLAKLESHVEHIQTDVADIKVDLRRVDAKIDGVQKDLNGKIDAVQKDLNGKIDAVQKDLNGKIDAVQKDLGTKIERLDTKIEGVRKELDAKFDKLMDSLNTLHRDIASAKVWAVLLYLGGAVALLAVMAKAFKWL